MFPSPEDRNLCVNVLCMSSECPDHGASLSGWPVDNPDVYTLLLPANYDFWWLMMSVSRTPLQRPGCYMSLFSMWNFPSRSFITRSLWGGDMRCGLFFCFTPWLIFGLVSFWKTNIFQLFVGLYPLCFVHDLRGALPFSLTLSSCQHVLQSIPNHTLSFSHSTQFTSCLLKSVFTLKGRSLKGQCIDFLSVWCPPCRTCGLLNPQTTCVKLLVCVCCRCLSLQQRKTEF